MFDKVTAPMTKSLDEPILTTTPTTPHHPPLTFTWRHHQHRLKEVAGQWTSRGRWWLGEGDRRFFRVLTTEELTLDLSLDEMTGRWSVAEVQD